MRLGSILAKIDRVSQLPGCGHRIVLDELMIAVDHELEAADVAEVGSAALGVRPRARTDQCRE
jgi:hypothetical protein